MERREPTLSSSSTPIPDRDETPVRRAATESRARPSPNYPPPSTSSTSPLAIIALLIALGGVGLGGYFGWQLTQAQTQLAAADARILELENRLSASSDESSQSLTQVDAKLRWADSEIRKLWGVAHDTNRKAIAANTEKIGELSKDMAAVKKDTAAAKTAASGLQSQLASSKTAMDAAIAKVDGAVSNTAALSKRLQDLTEQLDRTEAQLASLRGIEQKVRTNEEAIAAIDAYRRTINRDILAIKQQLGIIAN
jgi:chromosome segregation ATPase